MYKLPADVVNKGRRIDPCFGLNGFSEYIFYKHYSRLKPNGQNEDWWDTCVRVIEGTVNQRMEHFSEFNLPFDLSNDLIEDMFYSLIRMQWLPPGRGLWAMGTELVRERGSMALYNCAATEIGFDYIEDLCYLMDLSMHGVGVGFRPIICGNITFETPHSKQSYVVDDSREGWVDSIKVLLEGLTVGVDTVFDYSLIRPKGSKIVTFGGTASGPEPLIQAHEIIRDLCEGYDGDELKFKVDLANVIGCCVVSGNVRRSAEIALFEPTEEFYRLKDYERNPDRAAWGYMSNNSVVLSQPEHFHEFGYISYLNANGADIGFLNQCNIKYGRIRPGDTARHDSATMLNPCGEIPLENKEVCNVAETCPTRCPSPADWLKACMYATVYTTTVSLIPTHRPETNKVVARNRRIGVSIFDFAHWKENCALSDIITELRSGYELIVNTAAELNNNAGVPAPIRHTTIKPGGTTPRLAGRLSGLSHPTFRYLQRRVRVGKQEPMFRFLTNQGLTFEDSVHDPGTAIFSFYFEQGTTREARDVSVWEQAANLILLQREWADNAVSNTLYFTDPSELESVLAYVAPQVKSVSMLPHTDEGVFPQMPEEGLTKDEFDKRSKNQIVLDWAKYNADSEGDKYCSGDHCEV